MLAVQALYAGDHDAAARALQPVLAAKPTDPLPWMLAAHLRLGAEDSPSTASPVNELAQLAAGSGDRADLAALASRAFALKPWGPGQQIPAATAEALDGDIAQRLTTHPDDWLSNLVLVDRKSVV